MNVYNIIINLFRQFVALHFCVIPFVTKMFFYRVNYIIN